MSPAKSLLPTRPPSTACSPPRPAASAPTDPTHRPATPLRPVRRPPPRPARLRRRRERRTTTTRVKEPTMPRSRTGGPEWLEIEDIDPDTGELLGTHLQRLDTNGEPVGEPVEPSPAASTPSPDSPGCVRRPSADTGSGGGAAIQPARRQRHPGRTRRPIRIHPRSKPATSRSPTPSTPIRVTRCCSPDSSPTTAAGYSTQPNSAATPQPG